MSPFLGFVRILFLYLFVAGVAAQDKCENPKVRREWRKLAPSDREEWIRAVNCLAGLPHDPKLVPSVPTNISKIPPVNESSSFYDDLTYLHMDLNNKVHWTGMLFPWHRYLVQYFEDSLVEKCGYEGVTPYWDWTLDAHDFYNSDMFDDSPSGVGGWGDPANDHQISTGGFKDLIVAYPVPHHVRRNFSLFPLANSEFPNLFAGDSMAPPLPADLMINTTMTKENVDKSVNGFEGDFIGFHTFVESLGGVHSGAHFILAADMTGYCPKGSPSDCVPGPKWTPNDPLFYMHHAMIDKVWYDWQNKSPKSKYSFGGGSVTAVPSFNTYRDFPTGLPPFLNLDSPIPGDGLWNVTVWDVMDTQAGKLCYVYE